MPPGHSPCAAAAGCPRRPVPASRLGGRRPGPGSRAPSSRQRGPGRTTGSTSPQHGRRLVFHLEVDHPIRVLHVRWTDLLGPVHAEPAAFDHGRSAHADVAAARGDDHIAAAQQGRIAREAAPGRDADHRHLPGQSGECGEGTDVQARSDGHVGVPGRPPPPSANSTTGSFCASAMPSRRSVLAWLRRPWPQARVSTVQAPAGGRPRAPPHPQRTATRRPGTATGRKRASWRHCSAATDRPGSSARQGAQPANSATLPPAAVVLMVSVCSAQKRSR